MKQLIITSVAVVGMFLVSSAVSEAGGIRLSFGGGHGGHGHGGYGGYGCNAGYGGGWGGGYAPIYQTYPRYPQWHDTSHYDYHPGGYVPHGNHFDYVPGHYDFHQTGHFHH